MVPNTDIVIIKKDTNRQSAPMADVHIAILTTKCVILGLF